MNFSLKNYGYELFYLIGTVGKTFAAAVCECWDVSDIYTSDSVADFKQLSMDQ